MYKKLNIALLAIFTVFAISVNAAPMAYSVNADSGNEANEDSLYSIDLATGAHQKIGRLTVGTQTRLDTEGLAIAPDGTLWGIDDDALTLFPINPDSGSIRVSDEINLTGFSSGGGNDFGMTFTCENELYATSVRTQTLYKLDVTNGANQVVGSVGALGQNISAIASIGNPARIYGIGNGQFSNGTTDAPNLYSIDPETGTSTLIGPLGSSAGEYNQGGLSFDADGELWAITDRRLINNTIADLPSQILNIDLETGKATLTSTTTEVGFESLAVAPPTDCTTAPPVEPPFIPPVDPPGPGNGNALYPTIPTLSANGQIITILLLMLMGTFVLSRRL